MLVNAVQKGSDLSVLQNHKSLHQVIYSQWVSVPGNETWDSKTMWSISYHISQVTTPAEQRWWWYYTKQKLSLAWSIVTDSCGWFVRDGCEDVHDCEKDIVEDTTTTQNDIDSGLQMAMSPCSALSATSASSVAAQHKNVAGNRTTGHSGIQQCHRLLARAWTQPLAHCCTLEVILLVCSLLSCWLLIVSACSGY